MYTHKKITIAIFSGAFLISLFIAAGSMFFFPSQDAIAASLAPTQLVPQCSYSGWPAGACTICDIFKLAQNILNYIYYGLALPAAIIMILYGGFLMVVSGLEMGKAGSYEKGKKVLMNAGIGLIIIFLAWLMVDTIIKILSKQDITSITPAVIGDFGPWNKITCTPIITVAPKTHIECQQNMCVVVQGVGTDANCTVGSTCGAGALRAWKCGTTSYTCSCAEAKPGTDCQELTSTSCSAPGSITCPVTDEEQNLAKILKPLCGGSKSCGNVGACDTLETVGNGQSPPVCFSGCSSSSTCAPQNIHLSVSMLKALDATNLEGKKFTISSLTTGSHGASSLHYQGRAVDAIATGGTSYTALESSFNSKGATYVQCENSASAKIPCSSSAVAHIHAEFP